MCLFCYKNAETLCIDNRNVTSFYKNAETLLDDNI